MIAVRLPGIAGCVVTLVLAVTSCLRGDEVTVEGSDGKVQRRTGTILDLKGDRLTLRLNSGREMGIPFERVTSIDAKWSEKQLAADALYEAADHEAALKLYREAFNGEQRSWVKRRLLMRVIWCYRNTGKVADACRMFERLMLEDPASPYFDAIPLSWQMKQCPADVKLVVAGWLGAANAPPLRLVAASWLIVDERERAIRVVRELARDASDRVRSLAVAQLWKVELVTLKESRLTWWKEHTEATPFTLRAGLYYLLGTSYAKFGRRDAATLAMLRVPLMFPDDVTLGQRCLAEAADLLLEDDRQQDAIAVYRKSVELDARSVAGRIAARKLSELVQ